MIYGHGPKDLHLFVNSWAARTLSCKDVAFTGMAEFQTKSRNRKSLDL